MNSYVKGKDFITKDTSVVLKTNEPKKIETKKTHSTMYILFPPNCFFHSETLTVQLCVLFLLSFPPSVSLLLPPRPFLDMMLYCFCLNAKCLWT